MTVRAACFMKIASDAPIPKGGSSDGKHSDGKDTDEIELLSFEHAVQRAPTRTLDSSPRVLAARNNVTDRLNDIMSSTGRVDFDGLRSLQLETVKELAVTLTHEPVTVLKVVDKATPALWKWASRKDKLLTSVTLSMRTLSSKVKGKFDLFDLLQLKLEGAFICDMETVGNYSDQPWLQGFSPAIWDSAGALNVGPMERIEIAYQKITWSINAAEPGSGKVCGWDVGEKKAYTAA